MSGKRLSNQVTEGSVCSMIGLNSFDPRLFVAKAVSQQKRKRGSALFEPIVIKNDIFRHCDWTRSSKFLRKRQLHFFVAYPRWGACMTLVPYLVTDDNIVFPVSIQQIKWTSSFDLSHPLEK